MKIKAIKIDNFKGIATCKLDIESARNPIITLIGLNESGKTTVLEAIAGFGEDPDLVAVTKSRPPVQVKDYIPKHKRANFTGKIEIEATLSFEDDDKKALARFFRSNHGMAIDLTALPNTFTITRSFEFKDSEPEKMQNLWTLSFKTLKERQRSWRSVSAHVNREVWLSAVKFVSGRLPRICYFPTFLFELPERIYLEDSGVPDDPSGYYQRILQDVLDAQGEKLKLKAHVIDRVSKHRKTDPDTGVVEIDSIPPDIQENIDHVFRKMSTELNRVIFGAWNEIFDKRPRNKRIEVKWGIDPEKKHAVYCQIKILDGEERYALSERSLGFRWFFCFLLFTQFGAFREEGRKTVFLLDEPASNLHSAAQLRLLASLPRISGAKNVVIYTTHSHYMIEPLWLEQACIVMNKAVDYESDEVDADHFTNRPTDISIQKYRTFAGQHPDQITYFQPVLDRLDYRASPLVGSQRALIVEGKQDYYAMKHILPVLGLVEADVLPGVGSGNMDVLLSLFIGWGRPYLILLDDDRAGRAEKARYLDEYLIPERSVATYGDICPILKGRRLEELFGQSVIDNVKKHWGLTAAPKKGDFARYFQEKLAIGEKFDVTIADKDTLEVMTEVAKFVSKRLGTGA